VAHDVSPLFSPLQVAGKTLRNRIVMPPMVVNRNLAGPDGREWYGRRAKGVGLVIVESTNMVEFDGRLTADNLRPLVDAIHQGGAIAAIQLFPGVRGLPTTPAEMTAADIAETLSRYRTAAGICAAAGFDGIEPHGAHNYLLNKFFSPELNRRDDEYGGGMEGRMRLALRIVDAVREVAKPRGMLVLYRHTPVGAGYGMAESLVLAEALVKAGVDILDISPASEAAPGDRAAPFMRLGVPVIAVNQLDRIERALEVLRERRATLVAVARGLIADPEWPQKVREGRMDEIVTCTGCDNCFADLERGLPVGCSQWSA
jgi:2,4-dienoyl-CoA reductase-like NADH-dependent reductase (Old Yellow Enzyme family)